MDFNFELNVLEIVILIINLMLLVLYVLNCMKLQKLRKNYSDFMTKLGKGENINEMLVNYLQKVDNIENENKEIENYCQKLEKESKECLKKIGLIRYNAYKDTGSELSFTLAILDERNCGIVLNGIYGRDTSNIYAKPIEQGESKYALSKEEQEALKIAINQK